MQYFLFRLKNEKFECFFVHVLFALMIRALKFRESERGFTSINESSQLTYLYEQPVSSCQYQIGIADN